MVLVKKWGILLPVVLLLFSCQKNRQVDLNPNVNVANDIVISETAYNHAFRMVLKAVTDLALTGGSHVLIDSASVTWDTTAHRIQFVYNYKKCPDSVLRFGTFAALLSGQATAPGSTVSIVFLNYSENLFPVTGSDSVVNEGVGPDGKLSFADYITGGEIRKDTMVIRWNSVNRFRMDPSALVPGNDVSYYITGDAHGQSSRGYSFTASVHDSLTGQFSCPWISGGTIALSVPGADVETGVIDYLAGDGCTDKLRYDFEGNIYYLWSSGKYLVN
jgi:hypothetical protein